MIIFVRTALTCWFQKYKFYCSWRNIDWVTDDSVKFSNFESFRKSVTLSVLDRFWWFLAQNVCNFLYLQRKIIDFINIIKKLTKFLQIVSYFRDISKIQNFFVFNTGIFNKKTKITFHLFCFLILYNYPKTIDPPGQTRKCSGNSSINFFNWTFVWKIR